MRKLKLLTKKQVSIIAVLALAITTFCCNASAAPTKSFPAEETYAVATGNPKAWDTSVTYENVMPNRNLDKSRKANKVYNNKRKTPYGKNKKKVQLGREA